MVYEGGDPTIFISIIVNCSSGMIFGNARRNISIPYSSVTKNFPVITIQSFAKNHDIHITGKSQSKL
jgi:hypothetical protein